ncbi:MAG: histidine phosphatase family protein [Actinomycetaceae bacterium]|nr:histidine phosphatase family protein [Actinomycetaceae bacterium]
MRLVLIRHGQTPSNIVRALDTAPPGADLDETGRKQAKDLAEHFEQRVGAVPTHLFVSPLARTRQTAAPIEERFGLTAEVADGIRELIAGDLEMQTSQAAIETYLHATMAWVRGELDVRMPGGEDGWQVRARFGSVISQACSIAQEDSGENAVVGLVTHGALSRVMAATLSADITPEIVATYPMHNATTTVLDWCGADAPWVGDDKNWKALTWGGESIDSIDTSQLSDEPTASGLRSNAEG